MKLSIGYFYQKELNLYGDTGNIEILVSRAKNRGIDVTVTNITSETILDAATMRSFNLVFMGGGPDSGQEKMYEDLATNKKPFLKEYIENDGVALFICGSYQLLGHYYKFSDGNVLEGLGIFDLYTQHFGHSKPRSVGNISCELSQAVLEDPVFKNVNHIGDSIVGFENHGGMTFLKDSTRAFASVTKGFGNNMEDSTEGYHYKNSFGTYFHGPFLSKNAHVADYLLAKALKVDNLEKLDDTMITNAHTALLSRI